MKIRVNGQTISEKAVLAELKRLMDFYSQHMPREELGRHTEELLKRAREHAVGTQLLIEEVKRRKIEIPESEVDVAMAGMATKVGGVPKLKELLAQQGLSLEQFQASIRVGKQLDFLVARVTSGVPECEESELRKYYEEHAERYVAPDQAQVRHILIRPDSESEADRATTRSKLMGLKQKILEGDDFSELAAVHSECPSGKESGGSLGMLVRGTIVPELNQAIFDDMELGEISDVVETSLGFHILELQDKELGEPLSFEEAKASIQELLHHERKGKALSQFVDQLREKAVIEDDGVEDAHWEKLFDSFLDGQKGS
jgi:parvulin-like peptidyl-prolyl isomerase